MQKATTKPIPTIRCVLQEPSSIFDGDLEFVVKDDTKEVWSYKDGDGIASTTVKYETAKELIGEEKLNQFLKDLSEKKRNSILVDVPESFWTKDPGYTIRHKKVYDPAKPARVVLPIGEDTLVTIPCPYCGYPRELESDANGQIECEGCEHPYIVVSQI